MERQMLLQIRDAHNAQRRPSSPNVLTRPSSADDFRRNSHESRIAPFPSQRPSSARSARRSAPSPAIVPEDRKQKRASVPSRFVQSHRGTQKVKEASRSSAEDLSITGRIQDLNRAAVNMHKHRPSLRKNGCSGTTGAFKQAAAIVQVCMRNQTVPHPLPQLSHGMDWMGGKVPDVPIDIALKAILKVRDIS